MIGTTATLLLDGGSCCGAMGGWGWFGMMVGSLVMLGLIVLVAWVVQRSSTASTRRRAAESGDADLAEEGSE